MGINVLIIDPADNWRKKLVAQLRRFSLIGSIIEVKDGHSAIQTIRNNGIEVVMTEIDLPDIHGIEIITLISEINCNIKVIAYTNRNNIKLVNRVMWSGASGYLLKDIDEREISKAFAWIISGKVYVCTRLTEEMTAEKFCHRGKSEASPMMRFTNCEASVLKGILDGKTNKEIAIMVDRSVQTIRTHKKHIMKKIGVHNSAGIVKYLLENDIQLI